MVIKEEDKVRKVRYEINLPGLPIYNYQGRSLQRRHFVSVNVKEDRTEEIEAAVWYAVRRVKQGKVQMDELKKHGLGRYATRLGEFDAEPRKRRKPTDSYEQLALF